MQRSLRDQIVILTGASRGIGTAIAQTLAEEGAHLVLAARDATRLEAVADDIRASGGQATVFACDITLAEDRQKLVTVAEALGPIAVLINNAGVEFTVSVQDTRPGEVEQQVAVNLVAPIQLTKLVLPQMVERGDGAVVMVSSMSGKSPTPYNAIYTATKFGLNGFTASLRIELAGTGVSVGTVCPSFVAGAGMWNDTGLKPPRAMREVSVKQVTNGVRRVINGAAEVLVTPTPVRPFLALNQLWPTLDSFVLNSLGVLEVLKKRAETAGHQRD